MNKLVLFDTNILVYAHHQNSLKQNKAQEIINRAIEEKNGSVSWQNLVEFYNVVTDPRKVTTPITPHMASEIITDYKESDLTLVYPDNQAYEKAVALSKSLDLKGKQRIFDTLLAATMMQWGIETIYTSDVTHFKIFPHLRVINPFT